MLYGAGVMKNDWVSRICERVEQHVLKTKGSGATVICASGISPSGPVHLGNLREILTVHFVAEEMRERGWQVEHIHFWDDYDRLRKIPAGVSPDFAQYIGCPLADIPDPFGTYESYALRYIHDFTRGLEQLGVFPQYRRQSQAYRAGLYIEQIKEAMHAREEIFNILAEYQNLPGQKETLDERRATYYPFRVYCERCHKDTTQITQYDSVTAAISYSCQSCSYTNTYSLDEKVEGKLAWKVDWPMRWSVTHVDFEPAGEDHAAPGSSFDVGIKIIQRIFHASPPQYVGYAFVGMGGRSKLSSSSGTDATLTSALDIYEPCILRWLYARRAHNQSFSIDYGQGLLRLYDEWDALGRQVQQGKASEVNLKAYQRATRTSAGPVAQTPLPVSFGLLTSVLDVTQGNIEQVIRIVAQTIGRPGETLDPEQLEPRLSCAMRWVSNYLPEDERTPVRSIFAAEDYARLPEVERMSIEMLVDSLDDAWDLKELTALIYRIPRLVRGLPLDTPADDELKRAQRSFFIALYTLLCGRDTGPRLPTFLLSLGKERVKHLLSSDIQN
jgi:lysyl-tRNA synthetase class 1